MPRADARFELRLPAELLERVDRARGSLPRAAWFRGAAEKALGSDQGTPGVQSVDGPDRAVEPRPESRVPAPAPSQPPAQPRQALSVRETWAR